ncbi:glycoside hydrolase family 16 protein [Suillus lakei]|nr:glycoside hydrolase family 16 protein [Suillus lakei]
MHSLYKLFLAALPLTTLVGGHSSSRHPHPTTGERFFNDWDFFTGSDPTGGNVNYQNKSAAQSKGLAYVNYSDYSTVFAVDSTSTVAAGGNRDSVRITSQNSYNGGLFILDASKMPVGCSTWPSFWTVGPDWPYGGEIDIVEGINDQAKNQMTLHSGTNETCTIDTNNTDEFTGSVLNSNCYSTETSDSGCSILDSHLRMASTMQMVVSLHFFGTTPLACQCGTSLALTSLVMSLPGYLMPSTWGTPAGFWPAKTCNITANFYDHQMVIDTTICGNWATGAYSSSGCPGKCSDMVANATNYVDAKWVINYVAVYQESSASFI